MKRLLMLGLLAALPALANSVPIAKSQFKDSWPLTVDSGVLNCEPLSGSSNLGLVTFTASGQTYAVNGTAKGHTARRGWRDVREIWRDNPAIPGLKIDIGPLIQRGLSLCK